MVSDDRGDPGGDAIARPRPLLEGLLKLCAAAACLVGAIAAYRLLLHPLIESAFSLGEHASSIVRRLGIFVAAVLLRILEERIGSGAAALGGAAIFTVAHLVNKGVQGLGLPRLEPPGDCLRSGSSG
jgi:hypothetical protein